LQAGSYLVAGGIAFIVKILAGRERPIEALIEIPFTKSFPSGHTLTSIVFYMMLVYLLTYHYKKLFKLEKHNIPNK
jgi:membrane-associated phospholipid phosphatase